MRLREIDLNDLKSELLLLFIEEVLEPATAKSMEYIFRVV